MIISVKIFSLYVDAATVYMCGRYEKEIAAMMRHAFKNAIVGDTNLHSEVIPVANFSFNKDELRQIVKDEVKKIQSEEFVRRILTKL